MDLYKIGNRTELFADGVMAERMDGAYLKLHSPTQCEVSVTGEKPWENGFGNTFGGYLGIHSVVPDLQGGYLLYYRGQGSSQSGRDADQGQVTCLCRSHDGVHFERIDAGLHEFLGTTDNNIILRGMYSNNFSVFFDTHPACEPDKRYKALAGSKAFGLVSEEAGLYAYGSADGIRWQLLSPRPVITDGFFDSQNLAFYDAGIAAYRCYSRYFDKECAGIAGNDWGFRAIQSCISHDFINWSKPIPNQYGESITEHFYTNATIPCPGAEHILLSFPKRFMETRKKIQEHEHTGISDTVFMASRDGVNWTRLFKESWLRPGPDMGNWTDRNMLVGAGCVIMPDGSMSFYHTEHNGLPDNRIRRIQIRKHGFVSLSAEFAGGRAATPPLLYEGGRLRLNYSSSAAGYVKAALLPADADWASPENAYTLYGDSLDEFYPLAPNSTVALAGRPVRLHFELKDADIFSFGFL